MPKWVILSVGPPPPVRMTTTTSATLEATTDPSTCPNQSTRNETAKLSIYHGYGIFIGLAVVSLVIARAAVAVRQRIYKDKVWFMNGRRRFNVSVVDDQNDS
jgi:hypothetical protein